MTLQNVKKIKGAADKNELNLCRCSMWTSNCILYQPIWKRCRFRSHTKVTFRTTSQFRIGKVTAWNKREKMQSPKKIPHFRTSLKILTSIHSSRIRTAHLLTVSLLYLLCFQGWLLQFLIDQALSGVLMVFLFCFQGWLPQFLIDQALSGVLIDYLKALKQYLSERHSQRG